MMFSAFLQQWMQHAPLLRHHHLLHRRRPHPQLLLLVTGFLQAIVCSSQFAEL